MKYVQYGVSKVWYQDMLKDTVSGVFEDLKFKISEDSDQQDQQGRVRTTSILVQAFWNFKIKVLKYSHSIYLDT